MSRRRFYVTPELISDSNIVLSTEESHHLARVLRLKTGEEAFVFDGHGREYRCRVAAIEKTGTQLEIIDELKDRVESPLRLILAQALAKGEKFDFIVQKATELGVNTIAPIVTDHTDIKLSEDSSARRLDRWQRISLESLKQCGRRHLVKILSPVNLNEFVQSLATSNAILVMSERGGLPIREAVRDSESDSDLAVIIGPEGGWSDRELDIFQKRECKLVSLGPRILRTETAAIAAVTLVQHALGDISK